jgi:hypothetical protein
MGIDFFKSTVTNMVMLPHFEVIYDKFNVDRIYTVPNWWMEILGCSRF